VRHKYGQPQQHALHHVHYYLILFSAFSKVMALPSLNTSSPEFLTIPSKPTAPISYTLYLGSGGATARETRLIVFVNGLGLPASSWVPSIAILHSNLKSYPPVLTYDRYGQGLTTSRDPLDGGPGKEEGYGHDFLDVATDLHEIITGVAISKLGLNKADVDGGALHLLLIGASIRAPIVRLYAQQHPGSVAAAILLDSNIANVNYSDILPDPDVPIFDPKTVVSDDCTLEQYRDARAKLVRMFDLAVKNPESLDRRNSPALLPFADAPKLVGPRGIGPILTVVGHDPETFAQMSLEMMGTPKSLSKKFTNA
jgi:pimeloyl-ACP methyl ester carboxylesterase